MSSYNRVPLPPDETDRIESNQDKILNALRLGRQTNKQLSRISLDYGRCVRALRKRGHNIRCEGTGGLRRYTLLPHPDPEWTVSADVTLADGRIFTQTIIVNAIDMATARNRAQHKFSSVTILTAKRHFPGVRANATIRRPQPAKHPT